MASIETQIEIILWLSYGLSAEQIGVKVDLKKRTVEKYIETLKAAHGARNSAHLIGIALRRKLIK